MLTSSTGRPPDGSPRRVPAARRGGGAAVRLIESRAPGARGAVEWCTGTLPMSHARGVAGRRRLWQQEHCSCLGAARYSARRRRGQATWTGPRSHSPRHCSSLGWPISMISTVPSMALPGLASCVLANVRPSPRLAERVCWKTNAREPLWPSYSVQPDRPNRVK